MITIGDMTGMKKFLILWLGELISGIGSGMTAFALSIYVYQTTGSVSLVSVISLAAFLPTILLSPFGGVLADRIFEPMFTADGILADGIGRLIGTGQGRGIGFMLILS